MATQQEVTVNTATKNVALYVTDGMSDWEYSYLVNGLSLATRMGRSACALTVVGESDVVRSGGGLRILVDRTIDGMDWDHTAMLVLPGADTWGAGHDAILDVAESGLKNKRFSVAAICGATLGLARIGVLDEYRHTSNAPGFLDGTGYAGKRFYVDEPVVEDDAVITASGPFAVKFAAAVLRHIHAMPDDAIAAWEGLYNTGNGNYFSELMSYFR